VVALVTGLARRFVHIIEQALLAWFLLVMIVLGVTQVVLRKTGDSLLWADPAVRYSVLWIGFIAASVATREGRHISVDALSRFLAPRYARITAIIADLAAALITAILFVAASCAFLPSDPGVRLLAPLGWFLPDSLFSVWTEYLVGDDGAAFTITMGEHMVIPVAAWVATIVIPVSFSVISLRFLSRAVSGTLGREVPSGGEQVGAEELAAEAAPAVPDAVEREAPGQQLPEPRSGPPSGPQPPLAEGA
jgi:TRAP-type C4-dicarboxylate transport system permease small subunit